MLELQGFMTLDWKYCTLYSVIHKYVNTNYTLSSTFHHWVFLTEVVGDHIEFAEGNGLRSPTYEIHCINVRLEKYKHIRW